MFGIIISHLYPSIMSKLHRRLQSFLLILTSIQFHEDSPFPPPSPLNSFAIIKTDTKVSNLPSHQAPHPQASKKQHSITLAYILHIYKLYSYYAKLGCVLLFLEFGWYKACVQRSHHQRQH